MARGGSSIFFSNAPKVCDNIECCGQFTCFGGKINSNEKVLLPFTKIAVFSELRGPLADITVKMTYINPSQKHSIDCGYAFPIDVDTVLVDFLANIEGKVIKLIHQKEVNS